MASDADLDGYAPWELHALEARLGQCAGCPAEGGACAADTTEGALEPGLKPTGWDGACVTTERCARWAEHEVRWWLEAIGVPRLLVGARLEEFRATTERRQVALARAEEFVDGARRARPSRPLVLELAGRTGNGKSYLAAAVVRRLRARRCAFVYVPTLIDLVRRVIDHRPNAAHELDRVLDADVLVLDDLGAERATDFVREKLETVIHDRVYRMRPLVLTTNLPPAQLADRIGAEATRRLTMASEGLRAVLDEP